MRKLVLALFVGVMFMPCFSNGQSNPIKCSLLKELFVAENFARLTITSSDGSPEDLYRKQTLEHAYEARDILDRLQYKDSISAANYTLGQNIIAALKALVTKDRRKQSGQLALLYYLTSKKLEEYFINLTKQ